MSDRRPIASRNLQLTGRVARFLANRGVSPNLISQSSMVCAALSGSAFWMSGLTQGGAYISCLILAAIGCQFRLLCNLFDGMVAVEGGRGTPDGPFWNEAPDRLADALILIGMGLGSGSPALGWAAAALAISTAYVRSLGSEHGLTTDFRGPMAKPQRMASATAAALVAILAPTAFGWPSLTIALWIITLGSAITVLRRCQRIVTSLKAGASDPQ